MEQRSWRIDTLDARGGLAFASLRDAERWSPADGIFPSNIDRPCVFVGPPDFRPQPVVSRSVALAAGRGAFQTGLFIDRAEVAFPTPDAVAEFVRRTFLRSGGGDGADGAGGEGPSPPQPAPPDMPMSPLEPEAESREDWNRYPLMDRLADFESASAKLELGEVADWRWPGAREGLTSTPASFTDPLDTLCAAAVALIHELVRRVPVASDAHGLARWTRDMRMLGRILARLGLWPAIVNSRHQRSLMRSIGYLAQRFSGNAIPFDADRDGALRTLMVMAFADSAFDFDPERFADLNKSWPHWTVPPVRNAGRGDDTIVELARLPCPQYLASFFGRDGGDASLYHLLTAFSGAPASVTALPRTHALAVLNLALLASACIVSTDAHARATEVLFVRSPIHLSITQRAAIEELADEACAWLAEQLPKHAFSTDLEFAIAASSTLRYVE